MTPFTAYPHRCPECDHELYKARARRVLMQADGHTLLPVDLIYCPRCGWWRPATADDLDFLSLLGRTGQ